MNVTEVAHAACHRPEPDATFLADLGRPLPPGATPRAPLRGLPLRLPTHAPQWAAPRSQIRYPPPPTAMEHPPPLPNSRLFRLVSPCPLPHSRTHTQVSQTHAKGKVNREGQKLYPWPLENRLMCSLPSPGQDLPAQGCSRAPVWDRKGWVREQGQQEGSLLPARPEV